MQARAGPWVGARSMRACDPAPIACARRPRAASVLVAPSSAASPAPRPSSSPSASSAPHAPAPPPLRPSAAFAGALRPAPLAAASALTSASTAERQAVVAAASAAAEAGAGAGAVAAAATAAASAQALPSPSSSSSPQPHHRARGPPSDDDYSSSSSTDEDVGGPEVQGVRGTGGGGDQEDGGGDEHGDDGGDDDPPSAKNPRVEYLGALNGGAMLTVRGRLSLPLDSPDAVYRVLSDYDRCPEVFSSTVEHASSDRSSSADGGVTVVQGARWRVLGFSGSFDVRLSVREDPEARTLVFRLVESAFLRGFEGRWAVRPRRGRAGAGAGGGGRGCVVEHVLAVEPSVPLPRPIAAVASVLFTRQVDSLLADLRAEMERQRWGGGGGGGE